MKETEKKFIKSIQLPIIAVAVLWIIHLFQFSSDGGLGFLGVYPRSFKGIIGIFTSPFIHGSFSHLFSNSAPLFFAGSLIFFFYSKVALRSIFWIYLLTGISVWLFARPVYHIGASGVVYGLISFIFWNGVFRRNMKSIVLSLVVTVLYSGYILGIAPNQEGISWESHLFGAIVGAIVSFAYKVDIEDDEKEIPVVWNDEPVKYFLPRDIFLMTKEERRLERLRIIEEQKRLAYERYLEQQRRRQEGGDEWTSSIS
jgi:membrane associated rhomboid family serine protease